MCENSRLVCMNGKYESLVRCLQADQESRTIMQISVCSYHHVFSNSTIATMLIPLCLLSAHLSAAIEAVPVHRLDT
jgi:hypothetical protein